MATEIASVMVQCGWDEGPVTAPTIRITPNVLEVKRTTPASIVKYKVYVDVYDGETRVDYGQYGCSPLNDNNRGICDGLLWNFGTENGRFYYEFTYLGAYDVNIDIPFIVTFNGVQYPCVLPVRSVGERGSRGPKLRGPMFWDDCPVGFKFESGADGESFADIVIYKDVWYDCKKGHTKASNNYPGSDLDSTNGLWSMATVMDFVATKIFMATYALIKNLGVEVIEMKDTNGNILFEAKDGHVTCNTGNFKNINISGNSTFRGFVFKQKFEVTAANYPTITKNLYQGTWDGSDHYAKILDLEKTGSWIEVKSLPSNYNETYFAMLPTIRPELAYTDAYRDQVRQYMGNEVIIFNSTNKQLGVDTGEFSANIKPGMACHFKMVFSPEKSGDYLLERIIWEYTGPFQF